jgi:hypothetical protein
MAWCEGNRVEYVCGPARNKLLETMIAGESAAPEAEFAATGKATRFSRSSTTARVTAGRAERFAVATAEHLNKGSNQKIDHKELSEECYFHRRDMEEAHKKVIARSDVRPHIGVTMYANQLRLWFASLAMC